MHNDEDEIDTFDLICRFGVNVSLLYMQMHATDIQYIDRYIHRYIHT